MKRLITPVALALGIGLFAGTGAAVAAPPTPNDPSTIQFECPGFAVNAQATGSSKPASSSITLTIRSPTCFGPKQVPLPLSPIRPSHPRRNR